MSIHHSNSEHFRSWRACLGLPGALVFASLGLAGCGTSGPESGVDVEDVQEAADDPMGAEAPRSASPSVPGGPYEGLYDQKFVDELDSLEGQTVTVSADVNEVVAPEAFTIAGTDDTAVEPLLVIYDGDLAELEAGEPVRVKGVVHTVLDLPYVEDDLGADLDGPLYAAWDQEPYIMAVDVEMNPGG
jgi:hypothetical protein